MTGGYAATGRANRKLPLGAETLIGSAPSPDSSSTVSFGTPLYVGEAPLESCHLQSMANILEWQGLRDAKRKLGLAWGFTWDGVGGQLQNSRRWIPLANAAYGLGIERRGFARWPEAAEEEMRLAGTRLPFVAAVDAFYVTSAHHNREHFAHTLIVLPSSDERPVLVDPMNRPEATSYDLETYRSMRRSSGVPDHHLYFSPSGPRPTDAEEEHEAIIRSLAENLGAWPDSRTALDAYITAMEGSDERIDVAHPAAERLYLAGLLSLLTDRDRSFERAARTSAALSRRWYLVHTLSQQTASSEHSQRPRLLRLLADLRAREEEFVDRLARILPGGDSPNPRAGEGGRR